MRKHKEYVRYDLSDKKELRQYIKECEKRLGKLRLKWFVGISIGYIVFFFWFDKPNGVASIAEFLDTLVYAAVVGLIFWFVNLIVWSHCVNDLQDRTKYLENLEKKYSEME